MEAVLLLPPAAGLLVFDALPRTGCRYILQYGYIYIYTQYGTINARNRMCLVEKIRNSHRQMIMSSQAPSQVKGESQQVKAEADPAYINLKVKQQVSPAPRIIIAAAVSHKAFQDGAITHFRIKRSTQMRKVTSPVFHSAVSFLKPYSLWRVFVSAKRSIVAP